MIQATVKLKSVSPYAQSRMHETPKIEKEGHDAYEERTWREKAHYENGEMVIPPFAIKNCLAEAAKYLGQQIPGKGKSTYTKHFESGVLVIDPVRLGVSREAVHCHRMYVPSDGKRGGAKRVWRKFPIVHQWESIAVFQILDETITQDVFKYHLEQAGKFIGLGSFRVRNNGIFGRFDVIEIAWVKI